MKYVDGLTTTSGPFDKGLNITVISACYKRRNCRDQRGRKPRHWTQNCRGLFQTAVNMSNHNIRPLRCCLFVS